VDLDPAESFGFLGFDFRRLRSVRRHVWRAHYTPKLKKRTAFLRKLKVMFRRYQSQPVAIPRSTHVASDLLFHPVFDEAEALAGMSDEPGSR
jgi:hypothetical protein